MSSVFEANWRFPGARVPPWRCDASVHQERWIWPAPTKSEHVEPSTLKKQHRKALKDSKVRPFVLLQPAAYIPRPPAGIGLRCVDSGADRGPQFHLSVDAVRPSIIRQGSGCDGAFDWVQNWVQRGKRDKELI